MLSEIVRNPTRNPIEFCQSSNQDAVDLFKPGDIVIRIAPFGTIFGVYDTFRECLRGHLRVRGFRVLISETNKIEIKFLEI